MRRNLLFWGLILISFGGIFVLDGFKLLPGNPIEYLWQIFLIILGSWILLNSIWKPKSTKSETTSILLNGATRATIRINHGAGRLNINSGTKNGDLLTYSSMGKIQENVSRTSDSVEARLSPGSDIIPLVGFAEVFNWDLELSNAIPLSLFLETGASQTYANLSKLNITDLKISTGASTSTIILPSVPKTSNVSINAGVASMKVQIPVNVAARIRVKDGLLSLNIDNVRFKRVDPNTYQSNDYTNATNRSEIKIEAGVGSISIR